MELGQVVGAQLRHEGDRGAGIEGDEEDIRVRAVVPFGPDALARGDRRDAGRPEIRPEHAGAGETEMRRDQKPVDLLIRVVGEREDDPIWPRTRLAGLHGNAADDAVASRGRGNPDLVPVRAVALDGRSEVDGLHLGVDAHRFDGPAGRRQSQPQECRQKKGYGERYDPQCFGLSSGTRRWNRIGTGQEA